MSKETNNLLNRCLEIEGLLCLIERRGEAIPKSVADLLLEKTGRLHEDISRMVGALTLISDAAEEPSEIMAEQETSQALEQTCVSLDHDSDDNAIADASQFEENADAGDAVPTAPLSPLQEKYGEAEESPVAEIHEEATGEKPAEETSAHVHQPRQVRNDTVGIELTVNDKFRFRRELFSNSDVDLAEALQTASQMTSIEELEDYFYNDFCFDPENEVVKDFMRIISSRL